MHKILLYYKYVELKDPQKITGRQKALCEKLDLKGRIIIAKEGINGTVEGTEENVEKYIDETKKIPELSDIKFKISEGNGNSFKKLSVKTRNEIVTLGKPDLFPKAGETGGDYLSPDELHTWLEDKKDDFVILDMRNDYEVALGKFKDSKDLEVRHFRDIGTQKEKLENFKKEIGNKKVVAVCTGGIRCEKGTAFLKEEMGFKSIYQLHDGIVTYMEKFPQGYFEGALYVFDKRVRMRVPGMNEKVIGKCEYCDSPSETLINCAKSECRKHFIICSHCLEKGIVTCKNE